MLARLTLAITVTLSFFVPAATTAHAASSSMFGIDEGYAAPTEFKNSGASWDRVDFHWDALQPNGPTDWETANISTINDGITSDLASGISVVGVITNPPAWATRNGSVPLNLNTPWNDPSNYWGAFVYRLASTYAGRVNQWIIWNEPDIAPNQPGSTWAGSELEFYQLLKDASLAAHAANPQVKIIFAGTTYWSDILAGRQLFFQRVLEAGAQDPTAAANGFYFDAVDIHIYSSPYQIYTIPQAYRAAMAVYGLNKPIWISEMNIVPWNDPMSTVPRGGFRGTLDEQASYIIEAMAMANAAGVQRAAVYKMIDGDIIKGEPYGLIRNDHSQRPAYRAFQVATQYLDNGGTASYQTQNGAAIVTIVNGKRKVTVAWSTGPVAISLPITPQGTSAFLVDKSGQTTNLGLPTDPSQTNYVLNLSPATDNTDDGNPNDYIVGGNPVILVENGVGDGVTLGPNTVYYPVTGFKISGTFYNYFLHRGGLRTFGYPISRPFLFQGHTVQFFQRRVLELEKDGSVGQLNLLDPGLMPYTQINQATFPAVDPNLTHNLPAPGSKDYTQKILQYVQATAPNVWNGHPVNFLNTFTNTVTLKDAFGLSKPQPNLLPGINLEQWGVPTSQPAMDPNNHNFIYQRFQRGIMHYDQTTGVTQGLLLADYFKAIITGWNIPPDLEQEAQGSPFYKQYDANAPHWVARPDQLPNTDLTFAFEREPATP